MDTKILWNSFLEKIKEKVDNFAYDTWFKETTLESLDGDKAIVVVPLHIHKKHLPEKYGDIIEDLFTEISGSIFKFDFVVKDELIVHKQNINENTGVPYKSYIDTNLNENYLFETFVVGESNRFAHAAALAVGESPGKIYNPLFLYGKSGLGKTHLMHAIGNYIIKNSNKSVLYVTSEQFISDFLGLSKHNKKNNFEYIDFFKSKYRNIDVLIVDDIQFLAGCTGTQKEFFHTFQDLYGANKQIIISSDRSPDDLKLLEDRLRTRFSCGLTVNIYPPEFNLRVQIIQNKIKSHSLYNEIPDVVIEYIANNCQSDVRQLEGAITRLYAYAVMMSGKDIDLDLAIEALKDSLGSSVSTKNGVQKIQRIVADYYNVSVEDLKSKRRIVTIALPRQIAMYLSRTMTDESYPRIGMEFGGKNHSTVIHSFEKVANELKKNSQLKEVIEHLKIEIG